MSSIADGRSNQMNAQADAATAYRFVRLIENAEARRLGVSIGVARRSIADRLRAPPGTLETIRRQRKKSVPSWLMARIRAEVVSILSHEMMRLQNEINLARQIGLDDRDDDLSAATAQLAAAKRILDGS